ncbi:hypothetical protein CEXT_658741 [Caerostris extrusa]|uniref:DUF5641 domain-containing protein n=1 Tax=Caerostris extrusa TaxID=172846 RepID=A0AAV4VFA2_CAEEX|nr:hypothetical protein CEXT_658741 [Caerostris extrusa]
MGLRAALHEDYVEPRYLENLYKKKKQANMKNLLDVLQIDDVNLVRHTNVALPEPNFSETPYESIEPLAIGSKMTQHLWKNGHRLDNRLNLLNRPKWSKGKVDIKEGDLVLVKNPDNYCFLQWNLARIIKIHPDEDKVTEVVTFKR